MIFWHISLTPVQDADEIAHLLGEFIRALPDRRAVIQPVPNRLDIRPSACPW
jgi:hypothetical protein